MKRPLVHLHQVFHRLLAATHSPRTPDVLYFMARRATGNQTHQVLGFGGFVVLPSFVAFNGPLASLPTTDFASVSRSRIGGFAKSIPFGFREFGPEVGPPLSFRDKFDGQFGWV